jgi:hypothetical protein
MNRVPSTSPSTMSNTASSVLGTGSVFVQTLGFRRRVAQT